MSDRPDPSCRRRAVRTTLTDPAATGEVRWHLEKQARMQHLLAISAEIKANMPEDVTSGDNWLYGEDGLPG